MLSLQSRLLFPKVPFSENRADREAWGPHVVAAGEETVPGTGSRYLKSMYLVLNALENGNTDAEMGFALL